MFYVFLAVISGAMISAQSSSNGLLYPFLGVLGVGFVSQLLNAVSTFLYRVIITKKLPSFRGLPIHASFGGFCSVFVLGFSGYLVSHLGTAVTVCLSVSGQLFMSAVTDHFGLLGTEKVPFKKKRIPAFLCILAGVFIINFAGANSFSSVSSRWILFLLLLFAIFVGCVTVMARMFSYEASRYIGKMDGNLANACVGSVASLILLLITSGFRLPISGFAAAPKLGYLTGPLGATSSLLSMLAYDKMKIFHATILLLIGQIAAGIITDLFLLQSFPIGKLIGILVVCVGIFLDKKLSLEQN